MGGVAEHTGRVTSKYDPYWAGQLVQLRAAIERAASGQPAVVQLPGLRNSGARQSWYGAVEVRGRIALPGSMAHARSLGNTIAASGLCAPWPASTFRFTIAATGDTLTVSAAGGCHPQPAQPAATPQRRAAASSAAAHGAGVLEPAARMPPAGGRHGGGAAAEAADRFYLALGELADIVHGPRLLRDCHGTDGWPPNGVYFFFEPGEVRTDGTNRVVRVGTHALTATSHATLLGRLRQHRGNLGGSHPGGGNHRGSVFRQHVGAALIRRDNLPTGLLDSWLDRHGPRPGWAANEAQIEQAVSRHIQAMPFLWLAVPGRDDRGYIERNSIAITSSLSQGLDPPSPTWLGHYAFRIEIRTSGLWNIDHIHHRYDTRFPGLFDQLIQRQHETSSLRSPRG